MKRIFIPLMCAAFLNANCQENKWANTERYSEDNKKMGAPAPGEKRVVFMGNSITEGWKIAHPDFFSGRAYINRGISGQTTPQMLMRFKPDVIELNPAVVVILAGINDIAENTGPITTDSIAANITGMVKMAQAKNIQVVMCAVLPANRFGWRRAIDPSDKVIALNKLLKDYASQNNIPFVDYYNAMVDDKKGLPKKYAEDGIHPTLAGYKVMEPLVEEGIKKALARK